MLQTGSLVYSIRPDGVVQTSFEIAYVEFVAASEVLPVLKQQGICEASKTEDCVHLELVGDDETVHLHLACKESAVTPRPGSTIVAVERDRLPEVIGHLIHRLHLPQVLLIPVGKWRKVFDAVAFSLASNEDWQEIDTMATVELNTRDPLLCGPADFHTIEALVKALMSDASGPDQGLNMTCTTTPMLVEILPDGAVRISIGNPVLADEVASTFSA
jgi:hypothetical protein